MIYLLYEYIECYFMDNSQLFSQLQAFVSIAATGSFSKTAQRLELSQPSVSRQINQLEEYLGIRLIQRTTRRLSLTEAGRVYYEHAQEIQTAVYEAQQTIAGFKETPSGTLRISAPHT